MGVTGGVWRFWRGCARWRVGFEVVLMSDVVDMQIRSIRRRLGCAAGELIDRTRLGGFLVCCSGSIGCW